MKENELIFRSFMQEHLDKMESKYLNEFEELLDEIDPTIFKWLSGGVYK